ncbi:molecular chaperone DnaK [Mesorhizobium sp. Root157]|nr:molecular chaperone DnaK [Mesorhizobium sp. Root157]
MKLGNFAHELADLRAHQEREAGIASARIALRRQGEIDCRSCGEEIDPARRRALPSADRCLDCQQRLERYRRRRT